VSTLRLHVGAAERPGPDTNATFREDFISAVSHVGLGRDHAVALVEAASGRPFAACGATDLLPVLGELLAVAQHTAHANRGTACTV
jgi:hypothetical protein